MRRQRYTNQFQTSPEQTTDQHSLDQQSTEQNPYHLPPSNLNSHEELQREVDYYRAQCIARKLLEQGKINDRQYQKLCELNLKTFAPRLVVTGMCM